jgi:polyisoprenoid-binding protein YceI
MTETPSDSPGELLSASTGHWVLDPAQSSVRISHKTFWGLATVRGSFSVVSGEGDVGADGSVTGKLVVGAASVDTKNGKRDTHLRSAEFFKADEHPEIVFTASGAKPGSPAGLAVSGELEAAGTSRPLSFTALLTENTPDAATLTAEAEVDRAGYGMTWNQLGMLVGPTKVSVVARFTRQPATA